MTTTKRQSGLRLTVEEFMELDDTDDRRKMELDDGVLYIMSRNKVGHQFILMEFYAYRTGHPMPGSNRLSNGPFDGNNPALQSGKNSTLGMSKQEKEVDIHQLDYLLHEPEESEGCMYLAEIPALQGCMAWGQIPEETLKSLVAVAQTIIINEDDAYHTT